MNTELKPFQQVLVRQHSKQEWRADIYSHKNITTSGGEYHEIIPYEGNEHLLGTTDDAPKSKRWRAEEGDSYFCVTSQGKVIESRDYYVDSDDNRYNVGNYFQTKEEAEEMAKKFKAMLKGGE